MEPSSLPVSRYTDSPPMHAIPEAQLPIIECPIGTVPIMRNNRRDHIAAKTIDELIGKDIQQEVIISPLEHSWVNNRF